jgi:cytochrome P450
VEWRFGSLTIGGAGVPEPSAIDLGDPHRTYRQLREAGPIRRLDLPGGLAAWVLTRYGSVVELLRHPDFTRDPVAAQLGGGFRGKRYPGDVFLFSGGRQLFNTDGAEHLQLRRIVAPFFTQRAVARWRPLVAAVVAEVADRLARRREADLVTDFALPVAFGVIGRILGIPERLQPQLAAQASVVIGGFSHEPARVRRAMLELRRLSGDLIDQPRPGAGDDLLSILIRTHRRDGILRRLDVVSMVISVLSAGYEAMASLLANGALTLLTDRDLAGRVRDDPSAMADVVEELLRHEPPAPFGGPQFALRPVELCGVDVAPGEWVYPLLAAANRDPVCYPDPDRFWPGRGGPRVLSFGLGPHRCLGAELARLEAQLALTELVRWRARPQLAVDPATLTRRGLFPVRGLLRLPVRMGGGGR